METQSKVMGVRLSMSDARALAAIARANERLVSQEARVAIRRYIRQYSHERGEMEQ